MSRRPPLIATRYRLVRTLYTGHTATTYQAYDVAHARTIAVKLLRTPALGDPIARARFHREVTALGRVRHPNVIRLLDQGHHHGQPFLVTEWIPGRDLRSVITIEAPIPVGQALTITRDLLAGLDAIHQAGILMRDVKPENVLLTPQGRVVLIDFSIARDAGDGAITRAGDVLGTAAHLAPELLAGHSASIQSDLYAVAMVLYELLTARVPHATRAGTALGDDDRGGWPQPRELNPLIPVWLEQVILRGLAPNPARRSASAGTMRAALLGASQQKTIVRQSAGSARPDVEPGIIEDHNGRIHGLVDDRTGRSALDAWIVDHQVVVDAIAHWIERVRRFLTHLAASNR